MNLNLKIVYILLSVNFITFPSQENLQEDSSENFTGRSFIVWQQKRFIMPGSPAAKAVERDLNTKTGLSVEAVVHGFTPLSFNENQKIDMQQAESLKRSEEHSLVAFVASEFITPGSPAAKAVERDLNTKTGSSVEAVVHGFVESDK